MQQHKIGFYLLALVAAILLFTGGAKVAGAAEASQKFGNDLAPYVLAGAEWLAAICILLPKTRFLGVILAASYFGGAIAYTWLHEGGTPLAQMGISAVIYVGAALYYPQLREGSGAGFARP